MPSNSHQAVLPRHTGKSHPGPREAVLPDPGHLSLPLLPRRKAVPPPQVSSLTAGDNRRASDRASPGFPFPMPVRPPGNSRALGGGGARGESGEAREAGARAAARGSVWGAALYPGGDQKARKHLNVEVIKDSLNYHLFSVLLTFVCRLYLLLCALIIQIQLITVSVKQRLKRREASRPQASPRRSLR